MQSLAQPSALMRRFGLFLTLGLLVLAGACTGGRRPRPTAPNPAADGNPAERVEWPGAKADGSVLLPNQWSLHPAGQQVELADFPVNVAIHPGGRFAAILHCGFSEHQIQIVDLKTPSVVSRSNVNEAFYGMEFSKDGEKLYASGAGDEVVHVFDFHEGALSKHEQIRLHEASKRAAPAGLAVDGAGKNLYVANVWGHRVTWVKLGEESQPTDILLGTNVAALAPAPVVPSPDFDTAAAEKRGQAGLYPSKSEDTFPYACRLDEKRQRLYVSLWAQAAVAVIDLKSKEVVARWAAGDHPCEMALTRSGSYLFVANASRNTVSVFETASGKLIETMWAALYPETPPGSTPNSLALSPDERTLFVANADNNLLAVFDVRTPGKSHSLGFIPVGWYPTSVRVTPDGKHLLVANGKGVASSSNPKGPQPGQTSSADPTVQFIGRLFHGTLSIIDLPSGKKLDQQLKAYTTQAYQCSPLQPGEKVATPRPADNPIPLQPGDPSPIKYCIYIIKENRTYDQVLGDLPQGNGDPTLCLFPEKVTPNCHRLAREFVLLDNFYVESEVSADGHEWSMAAYATDFVEKTWPLNYGHNRAGKFPYPAEGRFPIAAPAGGYLWDRAREAGVSYRSYGEFVSEEASAETPARARVKTLQGHIDEWFHGWDLKYPDVKRAERFISELKRFETEGDMPRLQILRLPNDHTQGATPGARTPTAFVADNDLALGRLVEAVCHSKFWPRTAIFVVEDDAQNGPDHVDAHRTTAYLISPYTKRGQVDSSLYSTASMLRTMELILGLKPMSQFDAAARPMFNSFQATPDLRTYTALPANVDLEERNQKHAWGSGLKMSFAREDSADDLLLNEMIWRSVRGADNPMPAPVRAAFVFQRDDEEKD